MRSFTENVVSCVEVSDCLPGLKHSLATRRRAPRCRTGEVLRLPGPMLWVPDRIWHERAPKPKTLGLLDALNPFEEGGIWQTLARGTKYRACIEERRAAKRRFFAAP